MSAIDESRSGRRGNDPSKPGQRTQNAKEIRDGSATSQQNRKGGKQPQVNVKQQSQMQASPQQPSAQSRLQNGPVKQTQQTEAEKGTKSPLEHVGDKNITMQKSSTDTARTGNPWGAKPGTMANNKDFWLELRRQMTALQKQPPKSASGGPPARGG